MKTLYLLRHAHALEKQAGQTDKNRELSTTGITESFRIGAWLYQNKIFPKKIYSSSALRTLMTSKIIADSLKLQHTIIADHNELYEASVRDLLIFVNTAIDVDSPDAFIVGHNPSISYFAEHLTKSDMGSMATGSLAVIELEVGSWREVKEGAGRLAHYIVPAAVASS